jgi:rod shape determining protein RodA
MSTSPLQLSEEPTTKLHSQLLRIDPLLLLAGVGLALCSFVTLHGAGYGSDADKQMLYAGIGLLLALVMSRFDYSVLREYRYVFYAGMIVLNIAVYAFPKEPAIGGAHRWIPLPGFSFQSSEFGKLLLIVSLCAFAVDRSRRLSERQTIARVMLLALVPAIIVMKIQSDLGTGLIYVTVACSILFFLGTGWRQLAALAALFAVAAAIVLIAAPLVGVHVLQPYQTQRLTTFINPPANCTSANNQICYQLHEGLIAIGSGQKTGVGPENATQATFGLLPEPSTDFIFAVLGETYGFAGAALVLSLYALLIWRALRILTMAKNLYGTLIAGGVLATFMFQIFLNIGMTLGIMPVTGVPLPLLSYGGSSVLATFLAIGLLQSIHVQARMASSGKARVLIV